MSKALNSVVLLGRRVELITLSEDTGAAPTTATPGTIHGESKHPARRRLLPFGSASAPKTALHQGVLSLADQGVASITNFVTGVIIARASSKEEFGLYMLGFSLILLVTDLQTSVIATPYMVYAPRLKGRAHALYAGSTLVHQIGIFTPGDACAGLWRLCNQVRNWSSRVRNCLVGTGGYGRVDYAARICASHMFCWIKTEVCTCIRYLRWTRSSRRLACSRPARRAFRKYGVLGDRTGLWDSSRFMAMDGETLLSPAAFTFG